MISRSARRNSEGDVDDDRRTLILWERTGCLEMWTLGPNDATSVVMAATASLELVPLVVAIIGVYVVEVKSFEKSDDWIENREFVGLTYVLLRTSSTTVRYVVRASEIAKGSRRNPNLALTVEGSRARL